MTQMKMGPNDQTTPQGAPASADRCKQNPRLAKSWRAPALRGTEEPGMDGQKTKDTRRVANDLGKRVAASAIAQGIWKVFLWLMDQ